MFRSIFALITIFAGVSIRASVTDAFVTPALGLPANRVAVEPLRMSDANFIQETPDDTQERIKALVDNHPVLLFMKGNKIFPQVK